MNIEHGLQLDDKLPLIITDLLAIELFKTVDAGARDGAVQHVVLLKLAAVRWLVATHLNLDGYGGLALLANLDLLMLTLDGSPVW